MHRTIKGNLPVADFRLALAGFPHQCMRSNVIRLNGKKQKSVHRPAAYAGCGKC